MRSAMRTVGKRCEMRIVVRPSASARKRSKTACSASASSAAVGSSRTRMSASSRMKARASATFCHCPPDSSTPSLNQRPSCVSSPVASVATSSVAPPRSTARSTRSSSSRCSTLPTPTFSRSVSWYSLKSWKMTPMRARSSRSSQVAQVAPVEQDAPLGRLVEARQQLDEGGLAGAVLADQRQALPLGDEQVDVRAAPTASRWPGIAEADALEADALLGAHDRHRRRRGRRARSVGIARYSNRFDM